VVPPTFGTAQLWCSPMRRFLPVLLLAALVAAIAWWLWSWRGGTKAAPDPWPALPAGCVAVLEVPRPVATWGRITGTSQFWGDLEDQPFMRTLGALLARSVAAGAELTGPDGQGPPLLFAWCPHGGDSTALLAICPMTPSDAALESLSAVFHRKLPRSLWSGTVQEIGADSLLPSMALAWKSGLLLLAAEPSLLADVLRASGEGVAKDPLFRKAKASLSAGTDAHLLLRGGQATAWFLQGANGPFPQGLDLDGWLAMDVRLRPDALLMNGLLFPAGNSAAWAAIQGQLPGHSDVLRALPTDMSRLWSLNVQDPATWVAHAGHTVAPELFTAYAEWIQGGVAMAATTDADTTAGPWAVFTAADPAQAAEALNARCAQVDCPATEYRGIPVRRLPDEAALPALFGEAFKDFRQPYWAPLADLVVMAPSPAAMRAAIDAWTDRHSLALAPGTGDFFKRFSSDAVGTWWSGPAAPAAGKTHPAIAAWRAAGGAIFQLAPRSDGSGTVSFCLQHAPKDMATAGALWTTAMAGPLEAPPWLVKDYLSKTQQVLVQDGENRISLISCTGKVLWQRVLDGPIMGGVSLVDRYRNGKLQMLFNTPGQVWLVDRLGRDTEGFPVPLKEPACAPLSAFDYDRNKDWRVLVPLANGQLLNLGLDGKAVKGWAPKPLPDPAVAAVEHVRIKGKDYLTVPLRNGAVAVLDRRGEVRYDAKLHRDRMERFLGSRDAMDIADRRMLWADSSGAVLSGTLAGRTDTLAPPASGKAALFDVDGDGHDDLLRWTSSNLSLMAADRPLFSVSFPDDPKATAFPVPLDGRNAAIGLALPQHDQLRLYDANGNLWPGFPLNGATAFHVADINMDGTLELVTADAKGVVSAYALPNRP
jgi:hypothetical protein